jgi:hypothetical protein
MNDIEICSEILVDEQYNKSVIFDISLSKITDEKLKIGLLILLFQQTKDKNILVHMTEYVSKYSKDFLYECISYFKNELIKHREEFGVNPDEYKVMIEIIKLLTQEGTVELIKEKYSLLSEKGKNILIKILLEKEYYEIVSFLNKL